MNFKNYLGLMLLVCFVGFVSAQDTETFPPEDYGFFATPTIVPSVAEQIANGTFIEGLSGREGREQIDGPEVNPRHRRVTPFVPGKGLPGDDMPDPLVRAVENQLRYPGRDPIYINPNGNNGASFTPTDPTIAVGPNHVIGGWNIGFRIFDKELNPLTNSASLNTIFSGQVIGDPIFLYDHEADRFIITEFSNNPNGFKVAVSQGPNPLTDGWYVYQGQFNTGAFPDYTKFSIWHDGYYVTANIGSTNRLFVVEREKMLLGEPAQFQAFPLPGIVIATGGFYSPQVFSAMGTDLPQTPATVVYMQDDSYAGVSEDHLKLWSVSVDWATPGNSTVSSAVQIPVTPFNGVFNAGSFANLPQPFGGGPLIDAIQATIMNQAQLRKFPTYNSAVFNFVVRVNASGANQAGIRWYELRQDVGGGPWTIHQEGTYTSPGEKSAFNGSMAIDIDGNIGMAYSTIGTRDVQERISIKYTGRFADDPLGQMTIEETQIGLSTANNPNTRYADYSHTVIDPADGKTFYNNNEFFNNNRRNILSAFRIAPNFENDLGVVQIITPVTGPLGSEEEVTITVRNFGTEPQSNFNVYFNIDGGTNVTETFTGTLDPLQNAEFTFNATADLSIVNETYTIASGTALVGDEDPSNDEFTKDVTNEPLNINDIPLQNADLIVLNKGNNQFEATLTTNQNIDGRVFIKVYNISGQEVIYNLLENNNGKYTYNFDMSYASSGVYLVRIGNDKQGLVKRIIVR
jgi:hypothetical protein